MAKSSMKKAFSEYNNYIFDLDGTLYYQRKLRLTMAWRLAVFYGLHPWKFKELLIVKKFREVRENWKDTPEGKTVDDAQYECVAEIMNTSSDTVKSIVLKWIYENPLDALKKSQDTELKKIINKLKNNKKNIFIFSDYPVEDKLHALGIDVNGMYCSADDNIGELKPSPKGLKVILTENNIAAEDSLMIGDRMEKDGESAIGANVDFLILDKSKNKRKVLYKNIFGDSIT